MTFVYTLQQHWNTFLTSVDDNLMDYSARMLSIGEDAPCNANVVNVQDESQTTLATYLSANTNVIVVLLRHFA